ncbi:MAG: OmpH family outer membrane protein [Alphaproteobacteria bacterium]
MKLKYKTLSLAIALAVGLEFMVPGSASAKDPAGAPVIVVIDVQRILRESLSAQSLDTQLEARQVTLRDQFAKLEEELRAAEQELSRQRTVLEKGAFNEKRQAYEKRIGEAQRMFTTSRRQLQQTAQKARKEIEVAILQIAEGLGAELNADLVLGRHQVIFFNQDLDITSHVLERLNKQLPAVKLSAPENLEPAAEVPTE